MKISKETEKRLILMIREIEKSLPGKTNKIIEQLEKEKRKPLTKEQELLLLNNKRHQIGKKIDQGKNLTQKEYILWDLLLWTKHRTDYIPTGLRWTRLMKAIMHFTARISELRNEGINIECAMIRNKQTGKEFGFYYLPNYFGLQGKQKSEINKIILNALNGTLRGEFVIC
jgi:hypothetical protein